jgi:hypothetical protein
MSTRRGSVAASVPRERTPNGMIARKIIVVPCMVNSPLKVSAVTTAFAGLASCSRIRSGSMPPTRKNAKADVPYRMPIRLWSTVVSHAHTSLPTCGPARGSASSGVAMLGWPPPSCRRCPLVPGGRSPSGAPEGQESHSRPPLATRRDAPAGRLIDGSSDPRRVYVLDCTGRCSWLRAARMTLTPTEARHPQKRIR